MTARELLQAWLALSENRALSVETYLERQDGLAAECCEMGADAFDHGEDTQGPVWVLLGRWELLEMPIIDVDNGWAYTRPHEIFPAAYWTARKQLERDTREYLETEGDA